MTSAEYQNLPHFQAEDHIYGKAPFFYKEDIFEVHTLRSTVIYIKITDSWNNVFFDLRECTRLGEPVRCPLTANSILNSEIQEKIKENFWRLYSRAE